VTAAVAEIDPTWARTLKDDPATDPAVNNPFDDTDPPVALQATVGMLAMA
jgi:hypothetical protein